MAAWGPSSTKRFLTRSTVLTPVPRTRAIRSSVSPSSAASSICALRSLRAPPGALVGQCAQPLGLLFAQIHDVLLHRCPSRFSSTIPEGEQTRQNQGGTTLGQPFVVTHLWILLICGFLALGSL